MIRTPTSTASVEPMREGGRRTRNQDLEPQAGPLVSIVTAVRNGASTLERTIQSVLAQTYQNVEYIVIDGLSTDGTSDIIQKYDDRIDYWRCESDQGIGDAFNKGIGHSRGGYHLILNADDWLEPDAIETLVTCLGDGVVVACGMARVVTPEGRQVRLFRARPGALLAKMSLPHMSCLTSTIHWEAIGGYCTSKRVAMDHHLMLGLYLRYGPQAFRAVDKVIANYRLGGIGHRLAIRGFLEVRDNIRELTSNALRANCALGLLLAKYTLSRAVSRM